MHATGYPLRRLRTRPPSMIELALGLTVIAGLAFVTIRIKNMPPPAQTVEQSIATVRADTTPPVLSAGENKTP
jgi:hypothetical protein